MSAKSKVNLSLDEIIKNNKKEQKGGKRNVRRGAGNAGLSRKSQGVLKRKSVGIPRKRAVLKRGGKNIGRNNNQPGLSKVNPATRRLVSNLVKKALKQASNARGPRVGSVRNVVRGRNVIRGRRGAIRSRGQSRNNTTLTRVSQRSRVIGRRPRIVNRAPITVVANRGGRGNRRNNRTLIVRREPNPIQAQLNFLRRQQQQGQRQQLARVPVIRQQQQQVRRQIPAQRRQATRVIYVQQQRPPPVRRQPAQQIIYVQQQPRRQFSRGGQYSNGGQYSRGRQFSRGGRSRGSQRQNNDPFFEPPNFLQRIPAQVQSQFGGRSGRGGRFIEF